MDYINVYLGCLGLVLALHSVCGRGWRCVALHGHYCGELVALFSIFVLVGRRVDRARILPYQVFARNRFAQNQPPVLIPMSARVFVQNLLPVRITMFGMSVQVLQNHLPMSAQVL